MVLFGTSQDTAVLFCILQPDLMLCFTCPHHLPYNTTCQVSVF
jgi:hypothetical protein